MPDESPMYRSRRMLPDQREYLLKERQVKGVPWHGPPHFENCSGLYMLTAACYEHQAHVAHTPKRIASFEATLLDAIRSTCQEIFAWVVLPNHYHVLIHTLSIKDTLTAVGLMHGRTSYFWNSEENQRGRQVWHRATETGIKSNRHFWATLNYILHNPVKHGYVTRWQDWPYSNAAEYLSETGHEEATRRWREYPILDFGAGWDDAEL
jgi:putative transposase